jgi:hypothetical protein
MRAQLLRPAQIEILAAAILVVDLDSNRLAGFVIDVFEIGYVV